MGDPQYFDKKTYWSIKWYNLMIVNIVILLFIIAQDYWGADYLELGAVQFFHVGITRFVYIDQGELGTTPAV